PRSMLLLNHTASNPPPLQQIRDFCLNRKHIPRFLISSEGTFHSRQTVIVNDLLNIWNDGYYWIGEMLLYECIRKFNIP
ncbi:hypothetical protein J6590_055476, partial [Homalodisca vitripennis]